MRAFRASHQYAGLCLVFPPFVHATWVSWNHTFVNLRRVYPYQTCQPWCYQTHIGTVFYLELEYCAGGSLDQWIATSKPPRWLVVKVLRDALRGLRHVHSVHVGPNAVVLHRDVKPANILVDPELERGLLADFDIVRRLAIRYWCPASCMYTSKAVLITKSLWYVCAVCMTIDYWRGSEATYTRAVMVLTRYICYGVLGPL